VSAVDPYLYPHAGPTWDDAYVWNGVTKLLPPGKLRILEVGCGNGQATARLTRLGHDVVGIDASPSGIAFARKSFPECHFEQASIDDPPQALLEGGYDVVLAIEVLEHLMNPRALPRLASRALRPGGTLLLSTPYHGYLKNLVIAVAGKTDDHFNPLWDGGHVKFFSVRSLRRLLGDEGFADTDLEFVGRAPLLWKSMVCRARPRTALSGS